MAIILGPGEGRRLEARGSVMTFKAVSATTGGRFSLMDRDLPPGGRMPPEHRHPTTVEAFVVLEDEPLFVLDGRESRVGPGGFVLVPDGGLHTFGNTGTTSARVLILHAPALDGYFEGLADLWARAEPPTREAERELMRAHGLDPAE